MTETAQNTIVPLRYVPGHLFSWKDGIGVTEVSTIEANGFGDYICAEGFWIKSNKTDKFCHFVFIADEVDTENEVVAWVAKAPGTPFVIKILND